MLIICLICALQPNCMCARKCARAHACMRGRRACGLVSPGPCVCKYTHGTTQRFSAHACTVRRLLRRLNACVFITRFVHQRFVAAFSSF